MISAVREWLTSVVTAALLVSVAQTVISKGMLQKVASFTGSLILLIALLQPFTKIDWKKLLPDFAVYEAAVEARRQELELAGQDALAEEIAEATATCIRKQAAVLGVGVEIRVETVPGTDGTPLPTTVQLSGTYHPDLSTWIETELGIPAEHQVWESG